MISILVPALNEGENIGPTVATIRHALQKACVAAHEIIIIDDGSTDDMPRRVAELALRHAEIRVIRHAVNQGIGQSIRDGIAAATGERFMVVPGDNAVTPELIVALLACCDRADAILSVPFNKEMRGRRRNFLSMQYQAIYMIAFNVHVGYINGPGIWPTARARALALRAPRFSIISELNVKLLRSGGTYAEVPGQVKGGQKARSTVTLRNLIEVFTGFVRLLWEVHVAGAGRFSALARRVPIDFAPLPPAADVCREVHATPRCNAAENFNRGG